MEFLEARKDSICLNPLSKKAASLSGSQKPQSLNDSLEQQKKFDMFIERFFQAIAQNHIL